MAPEATRSEIKLIRVQSVFGRDQRPMLVLIKSDFGKIDFWPFLVILNLFHKVIFGLFSPSGLLHRRFVSYPPPRWCHCREKEQKFSLVTMKDYQGGPNFGGVLGRKNAFLKIFRFLSCGKIFLGNMFLKSVGI